MRCADIGQAARRRRRHRGGPRISRYACAHGTSARTTRTHHAQHVTFDHAMRITLRARTHPGSNPYGVAFIAPALHAYAHIHAHPRAHHARAMRAHRAHALRIRITRTRARVRHARPFTRTHNARRYCARAGARERVLRPHGRASFLKFFYDFIHLCCMRYFQMYECDIL